MSATPAPVAAHTPGPWTADSDGFIRAAKQKINVAHDCRMAMGTNVAYACGDHVSKKRKGPLPVKPQISANARLLAAAPDLLAALTFALHSIEWGCTASGKRIAIEKAKAAIARATQAPERAHEGGL